LSPESHRYLLRIESSDPELFARIHPPQQSFAKRLECLQALKDIGLSGGNRGDGGPAGQTYEQLANDLQFFVTGILICWVLGPKFPTPTHRFSPVS
jgi:biotin synthase